MQVWVLTERPNGAEGVSLFCLGLSKALFLTRYATTHLPRSPSPALPNTHPRSGRSPLLHSLPLFQAFAREEALQVGSAVRCQLAELGDGGLGSLQL